MKKYLVFFKYYISRFLVYRMRVTIWILVDAIHFIVFPFLWLSIYGARTDIAGFSKPDIVTYFCIFGLISIGFTSHIGKQVRDDIVKGDLNKHLVRPELYFLRNYVAEAAYKTLTLGGACVMGAILFYFLPEYFVVPHDPIRIALFIVSLLVAFSISQFLEFLIGLTSFWMGEIRALNHAIDILRRFFAGSVAPLVFYPDIFQNMIAVLPFKFMGYLSTEIYLERLEIGQILHQLGIAGLWIIALGLLTYYTWRKGLKTYDGSGI